LPDNATIEDEKKVLLHHRKIGGPGSLYSPSHKREHNVDKGNNLVNKETQKSMYEGGSRMEKIHQKV